MAILSVSNVSIQFGGVTAVDNVSFSVKQGEIYTIIGPNGAGKTTLFNLISRIYNTSSGVIRFEDQDITGRRAHDLASLGIARTFQNIELFERATVLQNLLLGCHNKGRSRIWSEVFFTRGVRDEEVAMRERVEDVIQLLRLERYRQQVVGGLPYGVRKMIELGRALCAQPKLILLDEPSSGLNDRETAGMGRWIKEIRSSLGITVLMVEHDMTLVRRVSDRVMALNYGKVLTEGTPREVQSDPDVVKAYLGG